MNKFFKIIFIFFSLVLLLYLALPNPFFPSPPPDAIQSEEPADAETPLRRAYFTNYTREEVLKNYQEQLTKSSVLSFKLLLPTYRLNYPPEEAQTLIRDQTRSTFLEEIVHPLRESVFVNGFEPKDPKDSIFIGGKSWRQKIIIRYVPSNIFARVSIAAATLIIISVLTSQWIGAGVEFKKTWKR